MNMFNVTKSNIPIIGLASISLTTKKRSDIKLYGLLVIEMVLSLALALQLVLLTFNYFALMMMVIDDVTGDWIGIGFGNWHL